MAKDAQTSPASIILPSGRVLHIRGPRSQSLLDSEGVAYCKAHGIPLAYDPVQVGLVPAGCMDDITEDLPHPRPGRPAPSTFDAPPPPPRIVELQRRYSLRRWTDTDRAIYLRLLDDPEVWRYLPEPYPSPLTDEIATGLIELSNTGAHHDVLAIEVGGDVVGQVRLLLDRGSTDADGGEISYWLGKGHWGRGIASDVVDLFTYHCFQKRPDLRSIVARVHADNLASARVLAKSGYRAITPHDASGWIQYRIARSDVLAANLPH